MDDLDDIVAGREAVEAELKLVEGKLVTVTAAAELQGNRLDDSEKAEAQLKEQVKIRDKQLAALTKEVSDLKNEVLELGLSIATAQEAVLQNKTVLDKSHGDVRELADLRRQLLETNGQVVMHVIHVSHLKMVEERDKGSRATWAESDDALVEAQETVKTLQKEVEDLKAAAATVEVQACHTLPVCERVCVSGVTMNRVTDLSHVSATGFARGKKLLEG